MHWFMLFVASSMADEENLQLLHRTPPLAQQPTCDVFLAPSTIPGGVCMHIKRKPYPFLVLYVAAVQILHLELLGRIGDIGLQRKI